MDQKPSFRESWKKSWRCIIPAGAIYEPCYESGKAVRHRIQLQGGIAMAIAGIYRWAQFDDDTEGWTFAMLTVNADGHPMFQRMHKPGDEKRMVVILKDPDYDGWLTCAPDEAKRYFQHWEGALEDWAAPLPPRVQCRRPSRRRRRTRGCFDGRGAAAPRHGRVAEKPGTLGQDHAADALGGRGWRRAWPAAGELGRHRRRGDEPLPLISPVSRMLYFEHLPNKPPNKPK